MSELINIDDNYGDIRMYEIEITSQSPQLRQSLA